MAGVVYLTGDATCPQARGVKVIAHVCNDLGGWGKGFVLAISERWALPEAEYRAWPTSVRRTSSGRTSCRGCAAGGSRN